MTNYKPKSKGLRPPWQKGESGNPAGLPKGYERASTRFNRFLKSKIDVEEKGPDGRIKKSKKVAHDVLIMKAIHDAVSSTNSATERTQARESILSRIEGKPVQPIGAAPDTMVQLTISPVEAQL